MAVCNGYRLLRCIVITLSITAVRAFPYQPLDPAYPVSDGLDSFPPYLVRNGESGSVAVAAAAASSSDTCEQTYGFMPCTTSWIGNLFLILVYGYLMFTGATYLSNGSELLLEILGPGIVGGLFLPMLGALPDAMLILVSGLSGSTETAQSQVSVGMGLLAGSTVMLLTVIWGSCVIVGKCDLHNGVALDKSDTNGFSLTGSGVSNDIWTSYAAWIMVISIIPFIIVQVPQVLDSTSARHLAVLIALIFSLLLLVVYCFYQVFQPWIQARRLNYVEHKHVLFGFLRHVRKRALGRLLTDEGEVNRGVLEKLFTLLDVNDDGYLSASELKALIVGMRLEELDLDEDEAVNKIVMELDTSNDYRLELGEFVDGISRWIRKAISLGSASGMKAHGTMKFLDDLQNKNRQEHALLKSGDESLGVAEGGENRTRNLLKAVMMLMLGTVLAAIFADPLVDAVDEFSDATSIPTFFISFIALPLATNASEAVSAIIFASRKRQRTASLSFSELYGSATMNNLLCLAVFLSLVYIRGLTWDFSSEVLVIIIVCMVMGVFASFRTTFPLWAAGIALFLYPLSLALVYVLDYIFGWS